MRTPRSPMIRLITGNMSRVFFLTLLLMACGTGQEPQAETKTAPLRGQVNHLPVDSRATGEGYLDCQQSAAAQLTAGAPPQSPSPPLQHPPDATPLSTLTAVFARLDLPGENIHRTRWQALPPNWRELPASGVEEAWRPISLPAHQQMQQQINQLCEEAAFHAACALKVALLSPADFPSLQVHAIGPDTFSVGLRYEWVGGLIDMPGARCRLSTKSFEGAPSQARVTLRRQAGHIREVVLDGAFYLGCAAHWDMGSTWVEVPAWKLPLVLTAED